MILVSKKTRCGICRTSFGDLPEDECMYGSEKTNHHYTCSGCVKRGGKVGLKLLQIMAMPAMEFEAFIKKHNQKKRPPEQKVIYFDPMKKLPKD